MWFVAESAEMHLLYFLLGVVSAPNIFFGGTNMKRKSILSIVSIVLVLTLVFTFVACNDDDDESKYSYGEEGLYYGLNDEKNAYEITYIGNYSGTDLIIPAMNNNLPVTSIGISAFYDCIGLTSVTIPDSVNSIGHHVFYKCSTIESVTFEDTTTWYITENASDWENKTGGTQIDVTDSSVNAKYFTGSYEKYYWYKL